MARRAYAIIRTGYGYPPTPVKRDGELLTFGDEAEAQAEADRLNATKLRDTDRYGAADLDRWLDREMRLRR